jgi:hypothetical protein
MCARGKEEKQEQQQGQSAAASGNTLLSAGKNNWKCSLCDKVFDSLYILNYHNMLEHSAHKRQPIGVA